MDPGRRVGEVEEGRSDRWFSFLDSGSSDDPRHSLDESDLRDVVYRLVTPPMAITANRSRNAQF